LRPPHRHERRDPSRRARIRADFVAALRGTFVSAAPPRALVIVPTYNERDNLPSLVAGVLQHPNVRVLVVDDQSPDGTGAVADELARQHPGRVDVMHRTGKKGLGRSYIDGMKKAIHEPVDLVCQMDADFSHDPARLPALIAATRNADVVLGSRYVP